MKKIVIVELQRQETWIRTFQVEAETPEEAVKVAHSADAEEFETGEECSDGSEWETVSVTEKTMDN